MGVPEVASEFKPRHLTIIVALVAMVINLFATATPSPAEPNPAWIAAGDATDGRPPTGRDSRPAPPIRVGSPVDSTWGNAGRLGSTPAGGHHVLAKASPSNNWSVDLPSAAGTAVLLYVAPSDPAHDAAVTTAITQIVDDNICRLGGGGDFVTVGIYYDGVLAGRVTFAHLERQPALQVGMAVPRWGTALGTVANLRGKAAGGSSCWTGPHVHLEMRAESQQACWIGGRNPGRQLRRADSLGFVSGSLSPAATTCPS